MKNKVLISAAALFLLFLGWRIVSLLMQKSAGQAKGTGRPPVAVEIDSVRQEPIQEIRQFTGTVYPLYQYIVAPKVSARILRMQKRIGDWVDEGEFIAVMDDAEYQQSVREAEANLKIAQASLIEARSQFDLATQELERVQSLQEKGIASPSELDAANTSYTAQKSRLELAQAQVEQRQAALKSAQIRLGYTTLVATQPGFIGERFVDEGALLSPNSPVVSIVGIDRVIVRTTIIERDYGRIRTGQNCRIKVDAFPNSVFEGHVARIAPVLEEASRVAKMEVEVDNGERILKPGMFAEVRVILSEKERTQTVPSRAVITKNEETGIFVVNKDSSTASYVPVQAGIVSGEKTEIVSPQIEGLVITLGQHLLADGSPVILPKKAGTEPNRSDTNGSSRESSP